MTDLIKLICVGLTAFILVPIILTAIEMVALRQSFDRSPLRTRLLGSMLRKRFCAREKIIQKKE